MEDVMRALFVLLAATLACALPAEAQAADWQAFQPPGGGFKIEMPGKPDLKSEDRNGHKTDTALVGIDKATAGADLVFMVKYQARSEAPGPEAQGILDNVVNAMAEGNTVISGGKDNIGNFPARTLVMQDKDKDTYQMRVVMTDKYFVEVLFLGPPDNKLGKRFLDSFSVE
jgi:hypothetical protein